MSGTDKPAGAPASRPSSGLQERLYSAIEGASLRFVSPRGPGRLMRIFYRSPIWLYRLGLGSLIGRSTLILITKGRRTGKRRPTPLGYTQDSASGSLVVISGWADRSQWYRNLLADNRVAVRVGRRRLRARAEVADLDLAIAIHRDFVARNPRAARFFPRLTGVPFDGSEESYRELARRCPVVLLRQRA